MHELSIALSIVEMACEEARRQGGARLETVHLKLGPLSGVVKDALLFSWDLACEGTPARGCRLAIEEVPVTLWCAPCGAECTPQSSRDLRCPECGAAAELRRGRELELTALEIYDPPPGRSPEERPQA